MVTKYFRLGAWGPQKIKIFLAKNGKSNYKKRTLRFVLFFEQMFLAPSLTNAWYNATLYLQISNRLRRNLKLRVSQGGGAKTLAETKTLTVAT